MSQIRRNSAVLAAGCALLALLAVGCSKKHGAAFDPDAGHVEDYVSLHPAEYRASPGACPECHGADLMGGISRVSCTSASRDGQGCHPGGPGGHTDGWLQAHSRSDTGQAAQCAVCHDNPANSLPPDCFNNSLCHGPKSPHPSGWRTAHQGTSQSAATACAQCHADKGTPSCYANSSCHAGGGAHPAGWITTHQSTTPSAATACAQCHADKGTPSCFTNSSCHGSTGVHPDFWLAGNQHGAAAEAAPGGSTGLASCSPCHGQTFGGGSGPSCLTCHGGSAPHPFSNWAGGGGRHTNVNTGNTSACARCHSELTGSSNCATTNGCH